MEYNNANCEVAILCNHQKSVSKAQETQLENLGGKIATLRKQKKILQGMLKRLNGDNKAMKKKIPVKKSSQAMTDEVKDALLTAKKK